jgi:hypothetical protein
MCHVDNDPRRRARPVQGGHSEWQPCTNADTERRVPFEAAAVDKIPQRPISGDVGHPTIYCMIVGTVPIAIIGWGAKTNPDLSPAPDVKWRAFPISEYIGRIPNAVSTGLTSECEHDTVITSMLTYDCSRKRRDAERA